MVVAASVTDRAEGSRITASWMPLASARVRTESVAAVITAARSTGPQLRRTLPEITREASRMSSMSWAWLWALRSITSTPRAIELQRLAEEPGAEVTVVPFNGNAEMTTAVLGGNVDAVLINASSDVVQNIESGAFVPLVASPEERLSWLPDTPTFTELGYDGLTLSGSTFGLAGPAGLPDDVVSTLEDTLQTCLDKPEVQEQLGEEYVLEEFAGAEELAEVLDRTQEVYEPILG